MFELNINETLEGLCFHGLVSQLKINVTLESLRLHGLVFQLKINVMLGSLCFSCVSVPVQDQCDFGKFVVFIG